MPNDRESGSRDETGDPTAVEPAAEPPVEEDEWGQAIPAGAADPAGAPEGAKEAPAPAPAGGRRRLLIVGAIAVVAALAAGYWWLRPAAAPPEPAPVAEAAPAAPASPPEDAGLDLPPLDASDGFLRALLAALTEHPDALAWLLTEDLARHIVVAVENLAEGASPRRALAGLAPSGSFRAAGDGGERQVDPDSFARYDAIAEAIAGADIRGLAGVIREVTPLMELAYAELGRPERTFAEALLAALDRLAAVPVPETPILLTERTLRFEYRDPELEGLDAAGKHLLRTGPDNQRKIQDALRRLAELLRADAPS